jgi:hypothetical protein
MLSADCFLNRLNNAYARFYTAAAQRIRLFSRLSARFSAACTGIYYYCCTYINQKVVIEVPVGPERKARIKKAWHACAIARH